MNILVTGAKGQLGSEIKDLSLNYQQHTFFFEDSTSLDITDCSSVDVFIQKNKINAVINCAAYTAVDKAEIEIDKAETVNSKGVYNIVRAIKKIEGRLIHISTDYVFSGDNCMPYKEDDKVNPINGYGKSKLKGENEILKCSAEAIILRTSWVYSEYGNNFVKTMLRLGKERKELNVIVDQVGTPTYARDLAKVCLDIISLEEKINEKSTIYHYSNEGATSWYDFAKAVMEISKTTCHINPIETKDYPTPAKRPSYSLLNKAKIKRDFNIEIPYWGDALKECLQRIENK